MGAAIAAVVQEGDELSLCPDRVKVARLLGSKEAHDSVRLRGPAWQTWCRTSGARNRAVLRQLAPGHARLTPLQVGPHKGRPDAILAADDQIVHRVVMGIASSTGCCCADSWLAWACRFALTNS